MRLAGVDYPSRLALGPMAGYTDAGFRRLAGRWDWNLLLQR